jgi:hypothetical protein
MAKTTPVLVKLRRGAAMGMAASGKLRPLFAASGGPPDPTASFGLAGAAAPAWFLAELADDQATPWDAAHARLADQLGLAPTDVITAEPDLPHTLYNPGNQAGADGLPFALGGSCQDSPQFQDQRPAGPGFAWHLRDDFSQLGAARDAVPFTAPFTRIAHIDTGYDPNHAVRPERLSTDLQRNFVGADGRPNDAADPNRRRLFDNSGHGTGTIGILAGGRVAQAGDVYLGGAPQAEIVPLRIANSVVLFWTSAFAQALGYALQSGCDVVTLSMGGLPSSAWREAVDAAYEAGVCIVAAAGNSVAALPTHHVVYPARYHRTIAACGVMADGRPYYDLPIPLLEGNWGPSKSMTSALAAFTPNIPWPRFGCPNALNLNGEGTSAATPQIAAAVALWYEKYKNVLPRDWRRVEAVRRALFQSARHTDTQHFGNGVLQARAALDVAPAFDLPQTPSDNDSFPFLRVITGIGIDEPPPRQRMFDLEISQRWMLDPALREAVPDPEEPVADAAMKTFMEALIERPGASLALRRHVAARYALLFGGAPPRLPPEVGTPPRRACAEQPPAPAPPFRRVRVYAVDPSFSTRLDTAEFNQVAMPVRWEKLTPGPTGEYVKVVDEDAAGTTYAPVDLDAPAVLAQDGLPPAEGNPAFHQQMTYAVSMITIMNFERALGRRVLWRPAINQDDPYDDKGFVRQLTIRPHALQQANAFYSPTDVSLRFGYFQAGADAPGDHPPGSSVYTCLSHDIIAHETTHAILDGMHRYFNDPSNRDVLALHEALADVVALLQHFSIAEILESQIARTRGDLQAESLLGRLAVQFGQVLGKRGALREAIGEIDESGVWRRLVPDPTAYARLTTPHERGALLVAAVFDALIAIYEARSADLLRIATGGTGKLPDGAIHPDLTRRLAREAAKSAGHVLTMCIRALDYVPPVDVTFGDYLRALITADFDLVPDDDLGYRVAFVEAFRRRGIYPLDVDTLSVETLRWRGATLDGHVDIQSKILGQLRRYAEICVYAQSREALFKETWKRRIGLHQMLDRYFKKDPAAAAKLGLEAERPFEVHALRTLLRIGPDGQHLPQAVVALTQATEVEVPGTNTTRLFRGGSTLVVDLHQKTLKYVIGKRIDAQHRRRRMQEFLAAVRADAVRALLLDLQDREPFAALHAGLDP